MSSTSLSGLRAHRLAAVNLLRSRVAGSFTICRVSPALFSVGDQRL